MATTQTTYTGNGSITNYSFTFEYIKQADVKVTLDTVATTAFTFANATTLAFTSAPANGVAIRIFRDTDINTLNATFFPGSAIKAEDLNNNFTQSHFAVQEADFEVDTANATAASAVTTANGAVTTANGAVTTANSANTKSDAAVATSNTASTNASAAVATANTASTNATNAVNTANTAGTNAASAVNLANSAVATAVGAVTTATNAATDAATGISTANGAVTTANTALANAATATTTANGAVTTANAATTTAGNAVTTANGAVTTANTADTNATAAVNTANAASAAVSNAVLFTLIANVAAIPGSPSNNDYIEIGNSTGIESFSALSGLPSGFVGATGLTVRLRYATSGSTWVFMSYFANDSETRYLTKNIPVVTGDSTNGSGQITLNCEANSHGVKIKGPPHSAGATYTITLPTTVGASSNFLTTDGAGNLSWRGSDYLSSGNSIINTSNAGISLSAVNNGTILNLTGTGASITTPLTLSGNPTAANHAANKSYVDTEVAGIVSSAPATLDTLNELAAALGDDPNFATTTANSIGTKLPLAGGTLTGGLAGTTATFAGRCDFGSSSVADVAGKFSNSDASSATLYITNHNLSGDLFSGRNSNNTEVINLGVDGAATFAGTVTANAFSGDGSALTNVPGVSLGLAIALG